MKFIANIDIMPLKEILDPQGKAVKHGLHNLHIKDINDVRIGKHIVIELNAETETEAEVQIDNACKKLLANMIMESYVFKIQRIND